MATFEMIEFLRALISCESLSPSDAGSLRVAEQALPPGFSTQMVEQPQGVRNLIATYHNPATSTSAPGALSRHLSFAGHVDVVPPGDAQLWAHPPFAGVVEDGKIFGRGASDMKGSIAAFVQACHMFLDDQPTFSETISIILTSDEETAGKGMEAIMETLKRQQSIPDVCLVGEPTSVHKIGDTIKNGRRGSFTATLTVHGKQGHVAYPHLADNPVPWLTALLQHMQSQSIDHGTPAFQPSNLEVVSLWTSANTSNVIPAQASALFNIRYNDLYTREGIETWVRNSLDQIGHDYELIIKSNNRPFLTPPNAWTNCVQAAVQQTTGHAPELSTSGGTSDARTIASYCPVVELGSLGTTAHQVDEHVTLSDLETLAQIYRQVMELYFLGGINSQDCSADKLN